MLNFQLLVIAPLHALLKIFNSPFNELNILVSYTILTFGNQQNPEQH